MKRQRNWDVRLVQFLDALLGSPFEWGRTDCASIVLWGLRVMYGPEEYPFPEMPGYGSSGEAEEVASRLGSLVALVQAEGGRSVPPLFMQTGDVAVIPAGADPPGLPRVAICVRPGFLVSSAPGPGVHKFSARDLPRGSIIMRFPVEA